MNMETFKEDQPAKFSTVAAQLRFEAHVPLLKDGVEPVSYTHLTLPTIVRV